MSKSKKPPIWFLIIAALIISGYCVFFVKEQKQETKQQTPSRRDLITEELADKYQAITGWEKNLTYTLQAQQRLITDKPVLFQVCIDDVFSRDGKTFVHFSSVHLSSPFSSYPDYLLELECSKEILDKILSEQQIDLWTKRSPFNKFFDKYAVVARIQEVSKPLFAPKGSVLSEYGAEIEEPSGFLFIAKGTCVDIVYIGEK